MLLPSADGQRKRSIQLGPADVVCGRTALARSHGGNLKFRRLISKFGPVYQDAKSRKQKKHLTMNIIRTILQQGGRFLRATCDSTTPSSSEDPEKLCLSIASRDFIYEKVSHALRSFRPTLSSPQFRSCYFSDTQSRTDIASGSGTDSPVGIVSLNSQGSFEEEAEDEDEELNVVDDQLYQPIAFFPTPVCRRVSVESHGDSGEEARCSPDWEPFQLQCRMEEVRMDPAELQVLFEL